MTAISFSDNKQAVVAVLQSNSELIKDALSELDEVSKNATAFCEELGSFSAAIKAMIRNKVIFFTAFSYKSLLLLLLLFVCLFHHRRRSVMDVKVTTMKMIQNQVNKAGQAMIDCLSLHVLDWSK